MDAAVNALTAYGDGGGPALVAGGQFSGAGSVEAPHVASWRGARGSALGSGLGGTVLALAVYDDGRGPALCAGGVFPSADSGDGYLAWRGLDTTPALVSCPPVFAALAFNRPPGELVHFSVTASDDTDPAPAIECVPPSGSFFPRGTTPVFCTATDVCGNQSTSWFPVTVLLKARRR
jgi:hypothetical protein